MDKKSQHHAKTPLTHLYIAATQSSIQGSIMQKHAYPRMRSMQVLIDVGLTHVRALAAIQKSRSCNSIRQFSPVLTSQILPRPIPTKAHPSPYSMNRLTGGMECCPFSPSTPASRSVILRTYQLALLLLFEWDVTTFLVISSRYYYCCQESGESPGLSGPWRR